MPARSRRLLLAAAAAFVLCLAPRLPPASATGLAIAGVGGGGGGGGRCELTVVHRNTLYNFSLTASIPRHPHGILSEDGFYKVAVNDSVLWFQLCDQMIFSYDPPMCLGCEDCGGPLRCGMQCSALVSNNIGGYDVCTTIGRTLNTDISLIDKSNPQKGVIVKMVSQRPKSSCSLSVSVLCDTNVAQVSDTFSSSGTCDYATTLRHPAGCARSISAGGNGWGWFGTLCFVILCLLGGYILIGAIYRYYFLGIHSIEAIPHLEFWVSLPRRMKIMLDSLTGSLRGHSRDRRGSYSPINY